MKRGKYKRTKLIREQMSNVRTGKPSPMKGKKHTEEAKKRMSEGSKGKVASKKTKEKLSIINKKRWESDGYREKMSKAREGKYLTGDKCWKWNGGKTTKDGYVWILNKKHPFNDNKGYIAEHRLVMEKKLGRYLTKNEEVHHKNGIKDDNRISNLELVIKKCHFGQVKCPHCNKKFKIK